MTDQPLSEASSPATPGDRTPSVWVLVRLSQVPQESPWMPFRWELTSVEPCPAPTERPPSGRTATQSGTDERGRWAAAICEVTLYPDEAEGYVLNLTTDRPAWFVHFRLNDEDPSSGPPEVRLVTLSYNEAGRLMDASEPVDVCPIDATTGRWLAVYAERFFVPEPKRRQRPASFRPTHARGPQ